MADRYQDRPFPADDDYDRGHQTRSKSESDPLAELARLIGQTDPFANIGGRANQPAPPRDPARERYPEPEPAPEADDVFTSQPSWMARAAAQIPSREEAELEPDFASNLHPVQRYAAAHPAPAPEPDYHQAPSFAVHPHHDLPHQHQDDAGAERYDDALYGELPGALPAPPPETNYDEPYSYEDGYADDTGQAAKPRRGGMITVAAVLALAVVGTGGAFAYRSYISAPRGGEPPVFKADTSPTKVIPPTQAADASNKLIQDRMGSTAANGTEKIVSREEQPVDPSSKIPSAGASPRVVFPPLNQNANPPTAASVAPGNRPPANAGNGTLGDEPRKIHTFAVRGDQADAQPVNAPVAKPAPIVRTAPPAAPRTAATTPPPAGNAPLSLSPQAQAAQPPQQAAPQQQTERRMASNAAMPQPILPTQSAAPAGGEGGFLVQISSQRSEADAQASFRAMQGKYPSVLGSKSPVIRRADLGEKGVYYRALVGPFGASGEASQFCGSLKAAGGQCVIISGN